jgi:hypothetical protein
MRTSPREQKPRLHTRFGARALRRMWRRNAYDIVAKYGQPV